MDKYIGKLLDGRYEILDIIGVGGMAMVYKARCRLLNRYVAIKILKEEYAQDEELRKRFYYESQAVAKLSHNNIVSVYDVSHKEGLEYIVMELVDGITLKDYLKNKGSLSWQESLFFAQQIAKALSHAHSRGIIHQDIKPQNILLLRDGTAKVTDFGIAKLVATQETKIIQEAIGSVHYMSPEQAKGGIVDYRTDIYSLGIVLYEMLTGRMPFEGENPLAIVIQHINAIPLKPSEIAADIPEAMDEVVMKAMSPIVSKRYFSADEIYNDLQTIKTNPNTEFNYKQTTGRRADSDDIDATQYVNRPKDKEKVEAAVKTQQKPSNNKQQRRKIPPKREKNSAMAAVVAVVGFAIIAIVICFMLIFSGNSKEMIKVPSFIGENKEKVLDSKRYEDFELLIADEIVHDPDAEEGEIMSQKPEAGEKVKKGSRIVLTVNSIEGTAEDYLIPDFVGKSSREVVIQLLKDGVTHKQEDEESDNVEQGDIIRTEPNAGEILKAGETLVIYVSSGEGISDDIQTVDISCPKIINMTLSEAKSKLAAYGLEIGVVTETESGGQVGVVLSQSIAPGVKVAKGAKVNVEVSIEAVEIEDPTNGEGDETQEPDDDETAVETSKSATLTPIALPQDGRETCRVQVKLDGKVVYDKTHNTSEGQVVITVKGRGSQLATIDVDGQVSEEIVNFV